MSYYEILLFLHVVGATIWLGSGFLLNALFFRARRTNDNVLIGRISANTEWLAKRIFIPTSLLTLLLGILLTIEGPWQFDQLWIVLGLAGFAATFLIGVGLIEPEGKRLHAAMEQHGPGHPASAKHSTRIDALSKLDLVLLFVVALLAVDHVSVEAALLMERPDFTGVVDRTGYGDELMLGPAWTEFFQLLKAAVDNVLVAQPR